MAGLRRLLSRLLSRCLPQTERVAFETALARAFEATIRHYALNYPEYLPHAVGAMNQTVLVIRKHGFDPRPFVDPALRPLIMKLGKEAECDTDDTVEMVRTVNQLLKLRSAQGDIH